MASRTKATRKTVLQSVKDGDITGVDLKACAVSVCAKLELHPSSRNRVLEILETLQADFHVSLVDAMLEANSPSKVDELRVEAADKAEKAEKANRRGRAMAKQRRHSPQAPVMTWYERIEARYAEELARREAELVGWCQRSIAAI